MKLEDVLKLLLSSDRLRIIKGGKTAYIGFLANLERARTEDLASCEVEKLRAVPELRSKYWKEKDLLPPCEPEETAQYSFSDLEMKLYYDIHIK